MSTDLQHQPQPQAISYGGPLGNLLDGDRFEQLQRVSRLMANSSLTPKHLRGQNEAETIGNCFRVVNQAIRWGFDPFAVADESYVVQGKLGYQGKLVAAVVNARAGLAGKLRATYSGSGMQRTVTIFGKFRDEAEPREISLTLQQAKTSNQMWEKDPDQKLYYSGVIKWARRHCPELILGTLTEDELHEEKEKPAEDVASALPLGRMSLRSIPAIASNGNGHRHEPEPETQDVVTEHHSASQSDDLLAGSDPDGLFQDILDSIKHADSKKALESVGAAIKRQKAQLGDEAHAAIMQAYQERYQVIVRA